MRRETNGLRNHRPRDLGALYATFNRYAMGGFANLGSLGIMIGGLATMAPERRDDVISLGFKSIIAGTLTTCLMGAIVGALN